eukprot:scaffold30730_cov31-Tisochrysis_lutea.AAC.5
MSSLGCVVLPGGVPRCAKNAPPQKCAAMHPCASILTSKMGARRKRVRVKNGVVAAQRKFLLEKSKGPNPIFERGEGPRR